MGKLLGLDELHTTRLLYNRILTQVDGHHVVLRRIQQPTTLKYIMNSPDYTDIIDSVHDVSKVLRELQTRDEIQLKMASQKLLTVQHCPSVHSIRSTKRKLGLENYAMVCNVLFQRRLDDENTDRLTYQSSFVKTPTALVNLSAVVEGILTSKPLLLEGPSGSGKSTIVRQLCQEIYGSKCSSKIIELHLDESMDSKTLIGTYVCTDTPGEFKWAPGAITQAVTQGKWVLIEDIDRAPFDVLTSLSTLLENGSLPLPGQSSSDSATNLSSGFRIFATRTTGGRESTSSRYLSAFLSYFLPIKIKPCSALELETILAGSFPQVPDGTISLVAKTYNTLVAMHSGYSDNTFIRLNGMRPLKRYTRPVTVRHVFTWLKRIARNPPGVISGGYVTEEFKTQLARDAYDIFVAYIPDEEVKNSLRSELARIWCLDPSLLAPTENKIEPCRMCGSNGDSLCIGRFELPCLKHATQAPENDCLPRNFIKTKTSLDLMEKIAGSVKHNEPCLLVGKTGNGKTHIIQALAESIGASLTVQNLNVQSDSADLLGGFKPVSALQLARPLWEELERLFSCTFSVGKNTETLKKMKERYSDKEWKRFVRAVKYTCEKGKEKAGGNKTLADQWKQLETKADTFEKQQKKSDSFLFSFVEGALVRAMRCGGWILLDEINLASSETIQRLCGLLDSPEGSIAITEKGDVDFVPRHPNFRIFAAMNPAIDKGKKDLPPAIRQRFVEFWVPEVDDKDDLQSIVKGYLDGVGGKGTTRHENMCTSLVNFHREARCQAAENITDGSGSRPRYTLRTLCRALSFVSTAVARNLGYSLECALYEGVCMSYITQLDDLSSEKMQKKICDIIGKPDNKSSCQRMPRGAKTRCVSPMPSGGCSRITEHYPRENVSPDETFLTSILDSYWMHVGEFEPHDPALPASIVSCERNGDKTQTSVDFVLTKSVKLHLGKLARAVLFGKHPVLVQGPTSSGKTSIIQYLACRTGHKVVRINNHEHTDVAEYIGSFSPTSSGKLEFKEGPLVQAMREGWWVVLDELNLAPSEVLEALNRLLDDNRELFIPDTQETVRPHPHFMLFATQNPPGIYGGRKVLSEAFRNRFLEVHMDDVPSKELTELIQGRTCLAKPFIDAMVKTMSDLQQRRQLTAVFAGKHGFVTPRDLLRWASRQPLTWEEVAFQGYALLGERLRRKDEQETVRAVIKKSCKNKVDDESLERFYVSFDRTLSSEPMSKRPRSDVPMSPYSPEIMVTELQKMKLNSTQIPGIPQISLTKSLQRLITLVGNALSRKEPILLVGETGCGKTTVVQLFAKLLDRHLHIVNCHANSEVSDFIGALRPVRGREDAKKKLTWELWRIVRDHSEQIGECAASLKEESRKRDMQEEVENLKMIPEERISYTTISTTSLLDLYRFLTENCNVREIVLQRCGGYKRKLESMFQWQDGPLIEAMRNGDFFLLDEISLAEDAVIERLNSVLEPQRRLTVPELSDEENNFQTNGSSGEITSHEEFQFIATMNPGGDFGKRELSPALRNRFTEIWVPSLDIEGDLKVIISDTFSEHKKYLLDRLNQTNRSAFETKPVLTAFADLLGPLGNFVSWLFRRLDPSMKCTETISFGLSEQGVIFSVRDIQGWISFIASSLCSFASLASDYGALRGMYQRNYGNLVWSLFGHGAALSLLDGLGLGTGRNKESFKGLYKECKEKLMDEVPDEYTEDVLAGIELEDDLGLEGLTTIEHLDQNENISLFGKQPFFVKARKSNDNPQQYAFQAPTTACNVLRLIRAMQLDKAILLEGNPGVGKTSLVEALATKCNKRLVRINLSEQTDIADLFGSDLPTSSENSSRPEFAWSNGVFLEALKRGDWVLLDELNLASQSVLEGLNACLDHRKTVYVPELGMAFTCSPEFRIFAAQNPVVQGGGRKGLPRSFLNRFTKVHVQELNREDMLHIVRQKFPNLSSQQELDGELTVRKMLDFTLALHQRVARDSSFGAAGSPWEFNLRDVFRWCTMTLKYGYNQDMCIYDPGQSVPLIFSLRLRAPVDRQRLQELFLKLFGRSCRKWNRFTWKITDNPTSVKVGDSIIEKHSHSMGSVAPRDVCTHLDSIFPLNSRPESVALPPCLGAVVHSMSQCVEQNWPVLLVGSPGCGKTTAVRYLASLANAKLSEISMSASTDATELLGCFEQVDQMRLIREVSEYVLQRVQRFKSDCLLYRDPDVIPEICRLHQLSECIRDIEDGSELLDLMFNVIELMEAISEKENVQDFTIDEFKKQYSLLERKLSCKAFEWVDGALVEGIENGHWVLLENVNFCNPSVLDRLNSLLEPNGFLLLNESGQKSDDGSARMVYPHKDFRIFMCMDPSVGNDSSFEDHGVRGLEISRAMRNRCIELCMLASTELKEDSMSLEHPCKSTARAILQDHGIQNTELMEYMYRLFKTLNNSLSGSFTGRKRSLSWRQFSHWCIAVRVGSNYGLCSGNPTRLVVSAFERIFSLTNDEAFQLNTGTDLIISDGNLQLYYKPVVPAVIWKSPYWNLMSSLYPIIEKCLSPAKSFEETLDELCFRFQVCLLDLMAVHNGHGDDDGVAMKASVSEQMLAACCDIRSQSREEDVICTDFIEYCAGKLCHIQKASLHAKTLSPTHSAALASLVVLDSEIMQGIFGVYKCLENRSGKLSAVNGRFIPFIFLDSLPLEDDLKKILKDVAEDPSLTVIPKQPMEEKLLQGARITERSLIGLSLLLAWSLIVRDYINNHWGDLPDEFQCGNKALVLACRLAAIWRFLGSKNATNAKEMEEYLTVALPTTIKKSGALADWLLGSSSDNCRKTLVRNSLRFTAGDHDYVGLHEASSVSSIFRPAKSPEWKYNGFLQPRNRNANDCVQQAQGVLADGFGSSLTEGGGVTAPEDVLKSHKSAIVTGLSGSFSHSSLRSLHELLAVSLMCLSIAPSGKRFHMVEALETQTDLSALGFESLLKKMVDLMHHLLRDNKQNAVVGYIGSSLTESALNSLVAIEVDLGDITGSTVDDSNCTGAVEDEGKISRAIVMLPSKTSDLFRRNWGVASASAIGKWGTLEEEQRYVATLNRYATKAACLLQLRKGGAEQCDVWPTMFRGIRYCLRRFHVFIDACVRRGLVPPERSSLYLGMIFSANRSLSSSNEIHASDYPRFIDAFLTSWIVSRHDVMVSLCGNMWEHYPRKLVLSRSLTEQVSSIEQKRDERDVGNWSFAEHILPKPIACDMFEKVLDSYDCKDKVTISNLESQKWRVIASSAYTSFISSLDGTMKASYTELLLWDLCLFFVLPMLSRKNSNHSDETVKVRMFNEVLESEDLPSPECLKSLETLIRSGVCWFSTHTMQQHALSLLEHMKTIVEPSNTTTWKQLGTAWSFYGCVKAQLQVPLGHIDPLLEENLKNNVHENCCSCSQWYLEQTQSCRSSLYDARSSDTEDPLISEFATANENLNIYQKNRKLKHSSQGAFETRSQFSTVLDDMKAVRAGFVSKWLDLTDNGNSEQMQHFMGSFRASLQHLLSYGNWFSDIINPFVSSCYQMLFGLQILQSECECAVSGYNSCSIPDKLSALFLSSKLNASQFEDVYSLVKFELFIRLVTSQLFGVELLSNYGRNSIHDETESALSGASGAHYYEETDEFASLFEEAEEGDTKSSRKSPEERDAYAQLFLRYLAGITQSACILPGITLETPTASETNKRLSDFFSDITDAQSYNSFDMMSKAFRVLATLSEDSYCSTTRPLGIEFWMDIAGTDRNLWEEMKNAYKPNKVKKAKCILERYLTRVCYLLREFPGNAQLTMLASAADKSLQIHFDSSISSVLTYLEALLQNSYKWENSQAKRCTLGEPLQELQKLVAEWRQDELASWEYVLLQQESLRCQRAASWWGVLLKSIYSHYNECSKYEGGENACFDPTENDQIREQNGRILLDVYRQENGKWDPAHDFFRLVENFIRGSPVGEYPARIILVKLASKVAYALVCSESGKNRQRNITHRIWHSLSGLAQYYSQYIPRFREVIKQRRQEIAKKLKESEKIHRWDEQTYYSLRESIEKSKRVLQRHAREYRDLLNGKANDLLQTDPDKSASVVTSDTYVPSKDINSGNYMSTTAKRSGHAFITEKDKFAQSATTSAHRQKQSNPDEEICNIIQQGAAYRHETDADEMKSIFSTAAADYRHEEINTYEEICTDIIEAVAELRQDPEADKMRKSGSLKRLLQFLKKDNGLQDRAGFAPQQCCSYPESLLQTPKLADRIKHFYVDSGSDMARYTIGLAQKCDDYYYRTIDSMQRLKLAHTSGMHKDVLKLIDTSEIGCLDHLQLLINEERTQLNKVFEQHTRTRTIAAVLKYLSEPSGYSDPEGGKYLHDCRNSVLAVVEELRKITDCLDQQCRSSESFYDDEEGNDMLFVKSVEIEEIKKVGNCLKDKNLELRSKCRMLEQEHRLYSTSVRMLDCEEEVPLSQNSWKTVEKARNLLENVKIICRRNVSTLVESSYRSPLFTKLMQNTKQCLENSVDAAIVEMANAGRLTLCANEHSFPRSVSKPRLLEALESDAEKLRENVGTENSRLWGVVECGNYRIATEHARRNQTLERLRFYEVSKCLEDAMKFKPSVEQSSHGTISIDNVGTVIRCIEQYSSNLLVDCLHIQKTLLKLLYVTSRTFCTVGSEGFCIPEEDGEAQDSGQGQELLSGTGIGQGEGKEDVSSQIENEEQVLGQKGEEQEENENDKSVDEEDKGLEMSEDFEGETYDREQQESENGEENDNDEEEELDRDMGDVDGEDEEVVDASKYENEDEQNGEELRKKDDTTVDNEEQSEEQLQAQEEETEQNIKGSEGNNENEGDAEDEVNEDAYSDHAEDHEENGGNEDEENHDDENTQEEFSDKMELDPDRAEEEDGQGEDNEAAGEDGEGFESENDQEEGDEEMGNDEETEEGAQDKNTNTEEDSSTESNAQNQKDNMMDTGGYDTGGQDDLSDQTGKRTRRSNERSQNDSAEENDEINAQDASEDVGPTNEADDSKQKQDDVNDKLKGFEDPEEVVRNWRKEFEKLQLHKEAMSAQDENEKQQHPSAQTDATDAILDSASAEVMYQPSANKTKPETEPPINQPTSDCTTNNQEDANDEEENKETSQSRKSANETAEAETEKMQFQQSHENEEVDIGNSDKQADSSGANEQDEFAAEEAFVDSHASMVSQTDKKTEESTYEANIVTSEVTERTGGDTAYTEDDVRQMRETLQEEIQRWSEQKDKLAEASKLWQKLSGMTNAGASHLCESLRLVLEPTLASKMKGDYRTGKRINMRKVIPFIASGYRKDKIWLRRTKPSDRTYQVMLAVDDSLSMRENGANDVALKSLSLVTQALTKLEVGEIAIAKFGASCELLHPFDMPFTDDSGARVVSKFSFQQSRTATANVLESIIQILDDARENAIQGSSNLNSSSVMQLVFLISDGILTQEKREVIRRWTIEAAEKNQLLVLLLIDSEDPQQSVLNTERIEYGGTKTKPQIRRKRYLDDFPFPYYLVISHVNQLPEALGNGLKQWFDLVANKQ